MTQRLLLVATCVLWALVGVAFFGAVSSSAGHDVYGRETTPERSGHRVWTWSLAALFVVAVAMTAWVNT